MKYEKFRAVEVQSQQFAGKSWSGLITAVYPKNKYRIWQAGSGSYLVQGHMILKDLGDEFTKDYIRMFESGVK